MKSSNQPNTPKRPRKKRATPAQLRSWAAVRRASRAWAYLTEEQRLTWNVLGKDERARSRGGKRRRLSGQKYFMKVNVPRAFRDLPLLETSPTGTKPPPSLHVKLTITREGQRLALKLHIAGAGSEPIDLFGSPPQSPGRAFCHDFRYLGPLPSPKSGLSDITTAYLKKFRNLPPGSKVFIRIRRFVDGQRELPAQAHALVPGNWQGTPGAEWEA